MTAYIRRMVTFCAGAPVLAWFVLRALGAAHSVGVPVHAGEVIVGRAVAERHTNNAVAAVVFDYRGYDTLGEEFIFFAAVAGVALLLREKGEAEEWSKHSRHGGAPDAVALAGYPMLALTVIVGLALMVSGHLTPGGGFQGGAVVASALVLVYLLAGPPGVDALVSRTRLDALEAIGVGTFAALALGTALAGYGALTNVLPYGRAGALLSSGTILVLNVAVGFGVTAGFSLVVLDFLREDGVD
jgi:multicomponent Na+:H+ antiporter subunit B